MAVVRVNLLGDIRDDSREWVPNKVYYACLSSLPEASVLLRQNNSGGGSGGWVAWLWGARSRDANEAAVRVGLARIDLHGLFVTEALAQMEQHMAACREWGVKETLVITGRGAHSNGGVAKLKPRVEQWIAEQSDDLRAVNVGRHTGAIEVELLDKRAKKRGFWGIFGW